MRNARESIAQLTARYEEMLSEQKQIIAEQREQIKLLSAENAQFKEREKKVLDALIAAKEKSQEIAATVKKTSQAEYNRLQLIAHKCERIADRITEKFPNEEETTKFQDFSAKLNELFVRVSDENYVGETLLREGEMQAVEIECGKFEPKKIINAYIKGESEKESSFNMQEVLNPHQDLDLQELCKQLGMND